MKKILTCLVALAAFQTSISHADYLVESRGSWPKTWPKELEPLRKKASTFEGPLLPALHYAITFDSREQFEAAWPHLLKVKTKGAPIILKRGPSFWLRGGKAAGICVHTPPAHTKPRTDAEIAKSKASNSYWRTSVYIELIVDGKIVDLNRIPLPRDTPIIDERFKKPKKK